MSDRCDASCDWLCVAAVTLDELGRSLKLFSKCEQKRIVLAVSKLKEFGNRQGCGRLAPSEQSARMTREGPGAVTVSRRVPAESSSNDDAPVDLQGHELVVDAK